MCEPRLKREVKKPPAVPPGMAVLWLVLVVVAGVMWASIIVIAMSVLP